MLESILGFDLLEDPYKEARAFYGPAFESILRFEYDFRAYERVKKEAAPQLIDDVASQVSGCLQRL